MSHTLVQHRAHKHHDIGHLPGDPLKPKVVLVGNPNVGKSVVFNYLSGLYVDVSNFPGTTVEVSVAPYLHYEVCDTPGIYGVSSFNDEERVARDIILNGDVILNVVDAVHLERDLFLTQQLIDMGKRVGVIVNMMDEARKRNIRIDLEGLEMELGAPVIGTVATKNQGMEAIHELIVRAREGAQNKELHSRLHLMLSHVGSQSEALLVLEGDVVVAERHGIQPGDQAQRESLYIDRRNRVNKIIQRIVQDVNPARQFSAAFGRWAVNTWTGIPILAGILYLVYLFIGVLVAQDLVDFTENDVGKRIVEYKIKSLVSEHAASGVTAEILDESDEVIDSRHFTFTEGTNADQPQLQELRRYGVGNVVDYHFSYDNPFLTVLFGEFGVVTMTFTYLIFLLLPLVLGFYFALSVMEDSGYLPRLATLVDRALRVIGLNGRAVIPLILGFGCVTMATITTRLLGTQREKTIATTILQLAIPCSAQLGVIAALLATAGFAATLIYAAVIFGFLVGIGTALNRAIPGETSPLLLDLPPMRLPQMFNVFRKTGIKTYFFMKEASPWFLIGSLGVSILQVTGLLEKIQHALQPLVVVWLKLPKEAGTAFVMGLVRRDFGAAGLYSMDLTPFQTVAALVTITLFVPCIASLMVMLKERGMREGLTIWFGSMILAFLVGGIVAQALVR